jgi:hypothetical protein
LHSKLFKKQLIFEFFSIVVFLFSQINIVDIQIEELLYKFRRSGAVFKEKDKRKEKKRKSFGAKPKIITPHMPLREVAHVVVNEKTSMKIFFGCHKSLLMLLK